MLTLRTRLPRALLAVTALGCSALLAPGPATAAIPRQAAVLVCQATGDGSYVLIRVLPDRLQEYRRNPNNLVPAPAGGCPASVGAGTEPIPTTSTPSVAPPATTPTPAPPAATTPAPAPETSTPAITPAPKAKTAAAKRKATTSTSTTPPASAVAGATASSTVPRPTTYTGDLPAKLDRLPNTGNETALLLAFGADLLLLGAGLRLRARGASR